MTLRCPSCGGKRIVFASMTDGMAVASNDPKYLCKDCNYMGPLVIEAVTGEPDEADMRVLEDLKKVKDAPTGKTEDMMPRSIAVAMVLLITLPFFWSIIASPLSLLIGDEFLGSGIALALTVLLYTLPIWHFKLLSSKRS